MNRELRATAGALTAMAILLAGGILVGCRAPEETAGTPPHVESPAAEAEGQAAATAASGGPLAGTDWRLVEIQSMDDAVGTERPDDPAFYTMRLNSDGTVNMRLNCNRANGTWSADPGADDSSGRFVFGPLAATRALCPPPSLDERIASQSAFVRSYLLSQGRLYLSLMADGGIYVWEPYEAGPAVEAREAEVPFETKPDTELEAAILRASPSYTREIVGIDGQRARYLYGRVDLNGDGSDEAFVYLLGSIFCGTGGCDLLLFTEGADGYSLVNTFATSRLPVIVSPERTAGWSNIIRPESGGGADPSFVRHVFDGAQYIERERLSADTVPEGTRYLAGALTFDKGIPLEPRR